MGQSISLRIKNFNKFDYFIVVIIASLAYGEYEALGAFTPIRLIGAFSFFYIIRNWKKLVRSVFAKWVKFFCFWWFYMTVSILWTPDKITGIIYWFHFTCIIGTIISLFLLTQKANNPLAAFSVGWMLFVIITIPIALWEITSGSHLSSGNFKEGAVFGGEWRKFAAVTFVNYNSYSLLLTYSLPFLSCIIWNKSAAITKLLKIVAIVTFVIVSIIILINSSRASFVCLGASIALMVIACFKNSNTFQRILLVGVICLLISVLVDNIYDIGMLAQILERLDGGNAFADSNRTDLIKVGLKIASDDLFFGGGIMSMIPLYSRYHADYHYAHNLVIEMLVEHGALICILFLWLFARTLKRFYRIKDTNYRAMFYYIILALPLMMVIDDSYFGRSGFWIYLASIISISETKSLIKNKFQYERGTNIICTP